MYGELSVARIIGYFGGPVVVDIFVSYASKDHLLVRPLVERLEADGWRVWWDRHIQSGEAWETAIERALDEARCTIVCWSEASIQSEWVRSEAAEAIARGTLVPVQLDDTRLPLRFRALQTRRLTGWPDSHDPNEVDRLLADLKILLGETKAGSAAAAARAPAADRSERRRVTLLRGLLVQHQEVSDDPEAFDEMVQALSPFLAAECASAAATLLQADQSGFLVAFGVGHAQEDDEIHAAETGFRLAAALRADLGLETRLGLATGLVVMSHNAGAAVPRLAGALNAQVATLAEHAEPGQLLIAETAVRRLRPYFDMRDAGGAYQLLARTAVRSRLDAARALGLSPLVGRRAELATLEAALDDVCEGQGRALCVVGDAGLGKSRLAHEFLALAQDRGMRVAQASCRAHDRARILAPFAELLIELLGLQAAAGATAVVDAIAALDPALLAYAPQLLEVIGTPHPDYSMPPAADPQVLRRSLSAAVTATVVAAADHTPLLLVLDEWHCADEASVDLLPSLVSALAPHRVLLLLCAPPEAAAAWPSLPHCGQIVLRPLTKADVAALACALTRAARVADAVTTALHERSDGVPLFVEELVRALIEDGSLHVADDVLTARDDILPDLPGSIEAVVRARLDRLDRKLLEVLRVAAVIGRQFGRHFLDRHFGDPPSVDGWLERAVAQGMLQQIRVLPQSVWRFRHAAAHQVAYDSLLVKRRQAIHAAIGAWLETSGAADSPAEALAFHFERAGNDAKAIDYMMKAAAQAARATATLAAARFYGRAVALLERLPVSASRNETLLRALTGQATGLLLTRGYVSPESSEVFDRLASECAACGDGPALFDALNLLFRIHYNRAEIDAAAACAAQMLVLAEDEGDATLHMAALTADGVIRTLRGDPAGGRDALTAAIAAWRPEGEAERSFDMNNSVIVQARTFLATCLVRLGEIEAGKAEMVRAADQARDLGHPGSLALALAYRIGSLMLLGEVADAAATARELLAVATTHDFLHWQTIARLWLGLTLVRTGEVARGVGEFRRAAAEVRAMGVAMIGEIMLLAEADMALQAGRIDQGLALVDEARRSMGGGVRHMEPTLARVEMRLLWARDPALSRSVAVDALALCEERGELLLGTFVAADFAKLLIKDGDRARAAAVLGEWFDRLPPDQRASAPVLIEAGDMLAGLQRSLPALIERAL